jgi:hypothetical protein
MNLRSAALGVLVLLPAACAFEAAGTANSEPEGTTYDDPNSRATVPPDSPPPSPTQPAAPPLGARIDGGIGSDADTPDSQPSSPKPGDGLIFLSFPVQNTRTQAPANTVLADIVGHLPASYGNTYYDSDVVTWGHETTHGINSHLRNNFNTTGRKANGFYVTGDQGVMLAEPAIRKSAMIPFVPTSLRGSRFATYVTGQTDWDDRPTYIFDEWVAYTNGSAVGVDLAKQGRWTYGWRDAVMGTLEFTVYAIAIEMAVATANPQYLQQNPQFAEFVAWNARRAMQLFREGARITSFAYSVQDAYYAKLKTSPDARAWRDFVVAQYGSAFAAEVFEIAPAP